MVELSIVDMEHLTVVAIVRKLACTAFLMAYPVGSNADEVVASTSKFNVGHGSATYEIKGLTRLYLEGARP